MPPRTHEGSLRILLEPKLPKPFTECVVLDPRTNLDDDVDILSRSERRCRGVADPEHKRCAAEKCDLIDEALKTLGGVFQQFEAHPASGSRRTPCGALLGEVADASVSDTQCVSERQASVQHRIAQSKARDGTMQRLDRNSPLGSFWMSPHIGLALDPAKRSLSGGRPTRWGCLERLRRIRREEVAQAVRKELVRLRELHIAIRA